MTEPNPMSVLDAWGALLAATVDAVLVIDHQGRIDIFNAAAEQLFGYQSREMLGRNVSALMPEPDHGSHDRYMQNYLRTHQRRIIGVGREVLAKRKDGSVFPVHLSIGEIPGRRVSSACYMTSVCGAQRWMRCKTNATWRGVTWKSHRLH